MEMLNQIMSIATSVFDAVLALLFFHMFMQEKMIRQYAAAWIVITALFSITMDLVGFLHLYKSMLIIVWCFIYCKYAIKQRTGPAMFFSIFFMALLYVCETAVISLAKIFFGGEAIALLEKTISYQIFMMAISRGIVFLFVSILLFVLYKKKTTSYTQYLNRPLWILLCAGIFTFGSVVALLNYSLTLKPEMTERFLPILSFSFFIISLFFLFLIAQLARETKRKCQFRTELRQTSEQLKQQDEFSAMYNEFRAIKHDNNNHMQIILSLAQQGNLTALCDYLSELSAEVEKNDVKTGIASVDAIINVKIARAVAHDITVNVECLFPKEVHIATKNLCAVLFNMLDNAIEACDKNQKAENKYISLSIKQKKSMLQIICQNPSESVPVRNGDVFRTSKKEGLHGIGLGQIKKIAKEHGGMFDAKYENGIFTVLLILANQNSNDNVQLSQVYARPKARTKEDIIDSALC